MKSAFSIVLRPEKGDNASVLFNHSSKAATRTAPSPIGVNEESTPPVS